MSIRDLKGVREILTTAIDYDMSLKDMETAIAKHLRAHSSKQLPFHSANCFRTFYRSYYTNGLSFLAIGNAFRAAGFRPDTYRVLG